MRRDQKTPETPVSPHHATPLRERTHRAIDPMCQRQGCRALPLRSVMEFDGERWRCRDLCDVHANEAERQGARRAPSRFWAAREARIEDWLANAELFGLERR